MTTLEGARWHVLVPVKATNRSKSRLGTDDRRPRLALAFAADTIRAASASSAVAGVLVVTDDELVAATARGLGAAVVAELDDPAVTGFDRLNAALRHGVLGGRLAELPVAALTADLPALQPAELTRALYAAGAHPRAFVADHEGTGTALLTSRRGAVLDPRFGIDSAAAHERSGAVRLALSGIAGLRQDVDWQRDLDAVRALRCGPATRAVLDGPATGDDGEQLLNS